MDSNEIYTKGERVLRIEVVVHNTEQLRCGRSLEKFPEIVVQAKRKQTFVATHHDDDMYACVDQCLHKITEQLRRHKDRVRDRQGPPHGEAVEGAR